MRLFMPILFIAAAIGLFFLYTNPAYQNVKTLEVEQAQYNDALSKAQTLQGLSNQLLAKRNTFPQQDIDKLQEILPDDVDNIHLIIDVNNIASRYGLTLTNLILGQSQDSSTDQSDAAVGSTGDPVGSLELGFSVTSDYSTFLAFLQNLEQSERLIDIEQISFQNGVGNSTTYTVLFRTYWLH